MAKSELWHYCIKATILCPNIKSIVVNALSLPQAVIKKHFSEIFCYHIVILPPLALLIIIYFKHKQNRVNN